MHDNDFDDDNDSDDNEKYDDDGDDVNHDENDDGGDGVIEVDAAGALVNRRQLGDDESHW